MRAVLFCLVVSANALPEAHLRGRVKDQLRDRDLSVPEDAKNHYANTDASSDEIRATNLEEGGFGLGLRRLLGLASNEKPSEETAGGRGAVLAASIKGSASKDTKSKAETAYATGGHAQPVIEAEVLLRDEVDAPEMTRQRFDIIAHDFDARRRLSPGDDDASHDGSFAPTVTQVPTRKPLAADNESIRNAVREWFDNRTAAEEKYGHIKDWDTSGVTVMSYLFDCSCRLNSSIPVFLALFSRVPEPNCSARSIGDEYSHKALKTARSRDNCRTPA